MAAATNGTATWVGPILGSIVISVACFSLVFWAVARVLPSFLHFSQSRWAGLLPAISGLFIAIGGWMRYRRRRGATVRQ